MRNEESTRKVGPFLQDDRESRRRPRTILEEAVRDISTRGYSWTRGTVERVTEDE